MIKFVCFLMILINAVPVFSMEERSEKDPFGLEDGEYDRVFSALSKRANPGEEPVAITDAHPRIIFSLSFVNEEALSAFRAIKEDVCVVVGPLLAPFRGGRQGSFYAGKEAQGLPYTMLFSKKDRQALKGAVPNVIEADCDLASSGEPGYYYQWDQQQIVKLMQLEISLYDSSLTLIDYDMRRTKGVEYQFPLTESYVNCVATGQWNIIDIQLGHEPIGGWSFNPRIYSRSGSFLDSVVYDPRIASPKTRILKVSCRLNGLAARAMAPVSYCVEEVDPKAVPSRCLRATIEDESIEAESEDES